MSKQSSNIHRIGITIGAVALLVLPLLIPIAASGVLTCSGDPTRTVFAGGSDDGEDNPPGACRQFDGSQALCLQAFHLGGDGIASCFYDSNNDECLGCGPGENEQRERCTNTCATPVCAADPTRTIFAGGPGTDACRQYDDDETNCLKAFHRNTVGGYASCWFDSGSNNCRGCGPSFENGPQECTNTCVTAPTCAQDTTRTVFAGGPNTDACHQFDTDAGMCGDAYHLGGDGIYASCFPTIDCRRCEGGGRNDGAPRHHAGTPQRDGAQGVSNAPPCISTCVPPCADQTRTTFVGGDNANACHAFDGNQSGCNTAFHLGGKGVASCWYDTNLASCRGCGPNHEGGDCTNTCAPATCTGRATFATGFNACQQFGGDQTACEAAFHRTDNGQLASCFYDSGSCRGCGPNHEAQGNCDNACSNAAPCALDPTRTIFAGIRGSNACRQFDGNQTSCNQAFHVTGSGDFASCFYDTAQDECRGCGPENISEGRCTNSCMAAPQCSDATRSLGECDELDGNATACENAFELSDRGPVSCVAVPRCEGCGLFNQADGLCTNTCELGSGPEGGGSCTDGIDNDMDGRTDCGDTDCVGDPACAAPAPALSWQGVLAALVMICGVGMYQLRKRSALSSR